MLGEDNYLSPRTACPLFCTSYSGKGNQQGKRHPMREHVLLMTLHVISFLRFRAKTISPTCHSLDRVSPHGIYTLGGAVSYCQRIAGRCTALMHHLASLNPQLLSAAVKLTAMASAHYPQAGDSALPSPVSDSTGTKFAGTHVFILADPFWILPDAQSCWR